MTRPKTFEHRITLIREAFRLEWFTITWMLIEAGVAISAGIAAHSLLLIAFGIDSIVELVSAGVLVWRLSIELRSGRTFSEEIERKASRIAGGLLLVLAAYVFGAAAVEFSRRHGADFSAPGLVLTVATIPIMYLLSKRKFAIAELIGSRALRADAIEGFTCLWLSCTVLAGLVMQFAFGAWWVDSAASLAITFFIVKEGLHAFEGEDECDGSTK